MEKRLDLFLKAKNITQSKFAESINVAKASISHIISGRNKPGYDFILSMARQYPDLNLDWLITGKGEMFKNHSKLTGGLFPLDANPPENADGIETISGQMLLERNDDAGQCRSQAPSIPFSQKAQIQPTEPRITKVLVFYDNGTFKELV